MSEEHETFDDEVLEPDDYKRLVPKPGKYMATLRKTRLFTRPEDAKFDAGLRTCTWTFSIDADQDEAWKEEYEGCYLFVDTCREPGKAQRYSQIAMACGIIKEGEPLSAQVVNEAEDIPVVVDVRNTIRDGTTYANVASVSAR